VTPQQPVAEVSDVGVVGLVGAVGRLKRPPAHELVVYEADPEAEPVHLLCGCHPPRVAGHGVLASARPPAEVAHHLGIGVELDLPLEVLVGEWQQGDPLGPQGPLGTRPIMSHLVRRGARGRLVRRVDGSESCHLAVADADALRAEWAHAGVTAGASSTTDHGVRESSSSIRVGTSSESGRS
jgi:hypothetical protein